MAGDDFDVSGATFIQGATTFSVEVLFEALHCKGWQLEDVLCLDMPMIVLRNIERHNLMEMGPDPFTSVNSARRLPTIVGIPIRTVRYDPGSQRYETIVRPRHDTALHAFKIITREV